VHLALSMTAAVLTTGAFIPQTVKTMRSGSADGLAWGYLMLFGLGISLWFIHGLRIGDVALTLANGLTLVMVGLIIWTKATGPRRGSPGRRVCQPTNTGIVVADESPKRH